MTDIVKRESQSLLADLATRYGMEPVKLYSTLRDTVFKTDPPLTQEEVAAACIVAKRYDMDPFVREIHVTRSRGRLLVMMGIDGWIRIAKRSGQFDGIEFEEQFNEQGQIMAVACKVHRKDETHPTISTAYMSEYRKDTEPWKQYPTRMLRHKAAKEALRYAFGISGIDDEEPEEIPLMARPVAKNQVPMLPKLQSVVVDPVNVAAPVVEEPSVPTREPGEDG